MPLLEPPPLAVYESAATLYADSEPRACGDDGRLVRKQQLDVLCHWYDRAEQFLSDEAQHVTYRHVPMETVGTRRVRYVRGEPLRPRRIDVDEEP